MTDNMHYVRPQTLDEVLSVLAEKQEKARPLAGGTDLLVDMRAGIRRPAILVDLKGVGSLHDLSYDSKTGLSIGACVTVNELLALPDLEKHYPILALAGHELATHALRNRATVAGNIVTASPCGDMSSPLLCLEARVVIRSASSDRTVPFSEFIEGVKKTVLAPDEIVERVIVPTTMIGAVGGYKKLKRIKGHDLGVVAVAMIRHGDILRAAVSSAAPTPVLLKDYPVGAQVKEIQKGAQAAISPIDDVRCTKEYRTHMVNVFVERLVREVSA